MAGAASLTSCAAQYEEKPHAVSEDQSEWRALRRLLRARLSMKSTPLAIAR